MLGSACKRCSKCKAELASMEAVGDKVKYDILTRIRLAMMRFMEQSTVRPKYLYLGYQEAMELAECTRGAFAVDRSIRPGYTTVEGLEMVPVTKHEHLGVGA